MNNWGKVKLGSILTESKIEAIDSDKDSRIRVLLNTRGIIKRPLKKEAKGSTKYFKRSAGQFIYGKQNLHKGAFGIIPSELDGFTSSSDLPAFDIDKSCLPEWLDYFLKQGDFYLSLIDIAKGAATKRIQPKALFEVELPLPNSIKEQQKLVKSFKNKESHIELLDGEIQTQKQLITQLKQAILQDAVQGKLTKEWRDQNPNVEPASELLERIKAGKEKPLPPIEVKDKPYDLPESWVWCRLGEVVLLKSGTTFNKALEQDSGDYMYVKVGAMNLPGNEDIITTSNIFVNSNAKTDRALIPVNSIIFPKRGGAIATNKKRIVREPILVDLNTMAITSPNEFNFMYLRYWFSSIDLWELSNGTSVPQINNKDIAPLMFSVPPLEEQKAIVEKVKVLMQKCNELELQINQNKQHANMLMQAVLKEAFEN